MNNFFSACLIALNLLLLVSNASHAVLPEVSDIDKSNIDTAITEPIVTEKIVQEKSNPVEPPIVKILPSERAVNNSFILTQQQWSIPKNASSILNMPAVRSVMQRLSINDKQRLVIRYPGGEVGILWASELKAWLVSLGVSSQRIELQGGNLNSDELKLLIRKSVTH